MSEMCAVGQAELIARLTAGLLFNYTTVVGAG